MGGSLREETLGYNTLSLWWKCMSYNPQIWNKPHTTHNKRSNYEEEKLRGIWLKNIWTTFVSQWVKGYLNKFGFHEWMNYMNLCNLTLLLGFPFRKLPVQPSVSILCKIKLYIHIHIYESQSFILSAPSQVYNSY